VLAKGLVKCGRSMHAYQPLGRLPGLCPFRELRIDNPGHLVTWGGVETQWAADLRSHSVTRLTQQYGGRYTNGNALLVTQPIGVLKNDENPVLPPLLETDVVDATRLPPLPACGS